MSAERILSRIVIDDATNCWLWQGHLNQRGYGKLSLQGQLTYAHRASYEAFIAPIPAGLEIDHLCRVHNCVNPIHLEPVTHRENISRAPECAPTTHCINGHKRTSENSIPQRDGSRKCRTCHNEIAMRSYRRKRAALPQPVDAQ